MQSSSSSPLSLNRIIIRLLIAFKLITIFSWPTAFADTVDAPLLPAAMNLIPVDETFAFNEHSGTHESDGNEFIDTFTGALRLTYTDMEWPGQGGLTMKVIRTYSGFKTIRKGYTDEFGIGWGINTMRLIPTSTQVYLNKHKKDKKTISGYVLQMPDGTFKRFGMAKPALKLGSVYLSADNWRLQFSEHDKIATIAAPNGRQYTLTRDLVGVRVGKDATFEWTITQEKDQHSNYINYEYENYRGMNILSRMHANDGRKIEFNYDRIHHMIVLKSIHAEGKTWHYEHDKGELQHDKGAVPLLHKVIRPDGLMTQYYYHCYQRGCQVRTIKHPTGSKTFYDYQIFRNHPDLQRILSKTLYAKTDRTPLVLNENDIIKKKGKYDVVGHWQFYYPQEGKIESCDGHDCMTTIVRGHDRRIDYQHAVIGRKADYMQDRGSVWRHGLLLTKIVYNDPKAKTPPLETHRYTWQGQVYSEDWLAYDQYIFDQNSQRALQTRKEITRDGTTYTTFYGNFDEFGQPQKITQAGPDGNAVHSFTYHNDLANWLISMPATKQTAGVGTEQFSYNPQGLLQSHDVFGAKTHFAYDQHGQLSEKTDPLGRKTTYQGYYRGQPQRITQPDGSQLTQMVDQLGRVFMKKDALGNTQQMTLDALDRPIYIKPAMGLPTSIVYNKEAGPGGYTTTRGTLSTMVEVDSFGKVAKITTRDSNSGEYHTQYKLYDVYGRKTFESFKHHSATGDPRIGLFYEYDVLDRHVKTGSTHAGTPLQATTLQYLPNNTVKKIDAKDQQSLSRYRAISLTDDKYLLSHIDPSGNKTEIKRNPHGDIVSVQQGDLTQTFAYDQRYHLISQSTPEAGETHYGRDIMGRLLKTTYPDGTTINHHYDLLDRIIKQTTSDGDMINQTYDANGNVIKNQNDNAVWQYQYNAHNQLTQATVDIGDKHYRFAYQYDPMGALSHIIYPDGLSIDYAPDSLGRPTRVGELIKQIEYAPFGSPQTIQYQNTLQEAFHYDNLQHLQQHTLKSSTELLNLQYQYDKIDQITQIHDAAFSKTPQIMTYDPNGQLVTANGPWGAGRYQYDAIGNIISKQIANHDLHMLYDPQNRLTQIAGSSNNTFAYDARGNIIDDGEASFTFNAFNKLIATESNQSQHYFYDGQLNPIVTVIGDTISQALYNHQHQLLVSINQEGEMQNHVYLSGKRVATLAEAETQVFHHNHLGSPTAITNKQGALISRVHYLPYGEVYQGEQSQARYTDKDYFPNLPIMDFNQRVYYPLLGRFMNIDPIHFNDANMKTFNRYAYANNNPYYYLDPTGEFSIPNFAREFFEGFVFGLSLGGDDDHSTSFSFYVGAGIGATVNFTGIASTIKSIGLAGRTAKYGAEKMIQNGASKKPIWSPTKDKSCVDFAYDQWKKHQHEFPELYNAKQYVEMSHAQWLAQNHRMSTKIRGNGDVLFYNVDSNTFTIFNAEGVPKTMFRPASGAKFWQAQ